MSALMVILLFGLMYAALMSFIRFCEWVLSRREVTS